MKKRRILGIVLLMCSIAAHAQRDIHKEYQKIDSLLKIGQFVESYPMLQNIEQELNKKDTLYKHILSACIYTSTVLEHQYRMNEKFDTSAIYGKQALEFLSKGKSFFEKKEVAKEEFWMHKNLIVSYFGLGNLEKAQKHKDILYKAYNSKKLPKNHHYIDQYFNFSFFKWNDKNVWGYEWYPKLPQKNRFSAPSFTKIVYYVYSTNSDGSDNEQIFRFHVLMFRHIDPKNAKFDYILERQVEENDVTVHGSYYRYTYKEDIDYLKLKNDIIEILENDIQPDTKRIIEVR